MRFRRKLADEHLIKFKIDENLIKCDLVERATYAATMCAENMIFEDLALKRKTEIALALSHPLTHSLWRSRVTRMGKFSAYFYLV
jgi:hypothetical protein